MSWLFLGEVPGLLTLAGGALCLAGVAVSRRRASAAPVPAAATPPGPGGSPRTPAAAPWIAERHQPHARRVGWSAGSSADAQPGHDQVLHQRQAVRPVHDARREAGHRGERAHHVLVGGVARVDDPVVAAEAVMPASRAARPGAGRRPARRGSTAPTTADGPPGSGRRPPGRGCSRRSARGRCRPRRAARTPRPVRARGSATRTAGCVRQIRRTIGSSDRRIAVAKPATRSVPAGSAAGSRSSRAASTAARMVTLCSASRRPAGVSRTRRPSGSISAAPTSRASAATCCDTVDVVMPISSATARIDPSRDSSSSIRRRRVSIRRIVQDNRTVCPSILTWT